MYVCIRVYNEQLPLMTVERKKPLGDDGPSWSYTYFTSIVVYFSHLQISPEYNNIKLYHSIVFTKLTIDIIKVSNMFSMILLKRFF